MLFKTFSAAVYGIDASIIAGRIRKERNDYTLLTRLIGQDAVRKQLEPNNGT